MEGAPSVFGAGAKHLLGLIVERELRPDYRIAEIEIAGDSDGALSQAIDGRDSARKTEVLAGNRVVIHLACPKESPLAGRNHLARYRLRVPLPGHHLSSAKLIPPAADRAGRRREGFRWRPSELAQNVLHS